MLTVNDVAIIIIPSVSLHDIRCYNTSTHLFFAYFSIKDTLNKGHLSNEDTVCSPNHIELCTDLPLN